MRYSLQQLASIFNIEPKGTPLSAFELEHLLTDSRSLVSSERTVFFAINGERNNGNNYIPELYKKGVRVFVVSDELSIDFGLLFPKAVFFQVPNVIAALQQVAKFHLSQL